MKFWFRKNRNITSQKNQLYRSTKTWSTHYLLLQCTKIGIEYLNRSYTFLMYDTLVKGIKFKWVYPKLFFFFFCKEEKFKSRNHHCKTSTKTLAYVYEATHVLYIYKYIGKYTKHATKHELIWKSWCAKEKLFYSNIYIYIYTRLYSARWSCPGVITQ